MGIFPYSNEYSHTPTTQMNIPTALMNIPSTWMKPLKQMNIPPKLMNIPWLKANQINIPNTDEFP